MKDSQFLPEKVSNKVAKELFERFQEYERIYQKVFAGKFAATVITGRFVLQCFFVISLILIFI